jgi:protein CSF1
VINPLIQNTSLELVVDSITNQYLLAAPTETTVYASQDSLDAEVSFLRLRLLQTLVDVDEAITPPSANPQSLDIPFPAPDSRIVSDIVLSLHDLTASFSELSGHPRVTSKTSTILRGSFSQVRAHLDMAAFHSLSQTNRTPQVSRQCAFELDESKTVSTSDNFHMELGDMRLQFLGKASPEIIIATLDSVASIVREATTHAKRTKRATREHHIWSALQYCRSIHMDDPLAMTQPSLLVQEGRPQRMRSNATWKLFMYLRHCLRFLSSSQREMLSRETPLLDTSDLPEQMDDLINILHERLAGWGFDLSHEEVAILPFVRHCFPSTHTSAYKPRNLCGHLPILSFHSGTLLFSVFERAASLESTVGNTLTFGPLHLVYRCNSQKLRMLPVKISGAAVGTVLSDLDSISTRHHVLSAVTEDVRYTIHPSFIVFLQRLLRLHGKYAFKQPTISIPPHYASRVPDDYWECFIVVKHISIQAAVEGMVLEVGLTDVNSVVSVLCATPPRAQPRLRRSISGHFILKSSQLYTRVRQADDKAEPFSSNGRDILTSLAFSSLVIDANYRMTGEQPAVIHGLLAMDTLVLSVPRSALLTYRLIEEWRTQYLPSVFLSSKTRYIDDVRSQEHTRYDKRTFC